MKSYSRRPKFLYLRLTASALAMYTAAAMSFWGAWLLHTPGKFFRDPFTLTAAGFGIVFLLMGSAFPVMVYIFRKPTRVTESDISIYEAMQSKVKSVGRNAAMSLLSDDPTQANIKFAELASSMKSSDWVMRSAAALAIGRSGCETELAVPMLIMALQDNDATVRACAAVALGTIGRKASVAVSALDQVLNDEDADVRWASAEAIEKIKGDEDNE